MRQFTCPPKLLKLTNVRIRFLSKVQTKFKTLPGQIIDERTFLLNLGKKGN